MSQSWVKVLDGEYKFGVQMKVLPKKGNLVYEYNPFRNYRLNQNMYEYEGYLYTITELEDKFSIKMKDDKTWEGITNEVPQLREKGELVDFVTDQLSFSLDHPVTITPQYSYDGSVNLILNDGINTPKLINSRFSATGRNTYEIIDRTGNNDTNIYDQGDEFELDTSLYKRVVSIPKIKYNGTYAGGNLKVGNYFFYFKLSDADGNETDFVGESGLVSVFMGTNPRNIHTGQKNENSTKNVSFTISNLDTSYDYLIVYYSRTTAENQLNANTEYARIDKKFTINNAGICNLLITGFEDTEAVAATDININYNIVDSAKTQAVCQNMLFLGNVHKPEIPYRELQDLSLRFLPHLNEQDYKEGVTYNYVLNSNSLGYYGSKFIHDKTGYWGNEFYRLGIVYILKNGDLTPAFNIRGGIIDNNSKFTEIPVYKESEDGQQYREYIPYNEETYRVIQDESSNIACENVKGVIRLDPSQETDTIYSINIKVSPNVIEELKQYVKGFFFVRQTRIPTILAQGITLGVDKVSRIPCIPTYGGILDTLTEVDKTHITTDDLADVNYISEGFLHRYKFDFAKKKSSVWSKIGKIALATAAIVGAVAATVVTFGAALAPMGALLITAAATTGAVGAATTIAVRQELRYYVKRLGAKKTYKGRETKAPSGYTIKEVDISRRLCQPFAPRIIPKDSSTVDIQAILCPDYELNQAYYNSVFTGNEHLIKVNKSQTANFGSQYTSSCYFDNNNDRHFFIRSYRDVDMAPFSTKCKVMGVPDGVQAVGLDGLIFRSKAGSAEEAWRFENVGISFGDPAEKPSLLQKVQQAKESTEDYLTEEGQEEDPLEELTVDAATKIINTDIIRGNFSPYLAVNSEELRPAELVTIYTPGFDKLSVDELIDIRQNDNSPFFAISERISISELSNVVGLQNQVRTEDYEFDCYRGDCYICQFTHRLNRNFNDPSAPYNDDIVDTKTWKDNYNPDKTQNYGKINLGDVNAVKLGMWVTFKVRSSNNLNIRTLDGSNVDETAMTGHPRGFYPYYDMISEGTYKHPDSYIYNKGFQKSVGDKWNFETPDVPYIKNWFGTRIMYSDIHITDSYKNGFRVFQGQNYRDYTREYGEIVKLIPFESSLLCVFEHGIALIPVNERAVAGQGQGGNVYINTSNVLPENPKIISDMFGSQWADSVLKVPGKTGDSAQYVYGVDTVAKKIWRTDGNSLECISDFKVQEFLNNNITLGERELNPILGIRNVKTFYNAFKRDVMFTFYDNTYGFEEKVWNLCWNETLQKFITFYSWVPSFMENINNIPFSFDRNTSKWIAKLGISHTESSFADGITLSNVTIPNYHLAKLNGTKEYVKDYSFKYSYVDKRGSVIEVTESIENLNDYIDVSKDNVKDGFIGVLSLSNRIVPNQFYTVNYQLERDNQFNYENFDILQIGTITLSQKDAKYEGQKIPVWGLYFKQMDDTLFVPVYYEDIVNGESQLIEVCTTNNTIKEQEFAYLKVDLYNPETLLSELYYRNSAGNSYADYDTHKLGPDKLTVTHTDGLWIKDVATISRLKAKYINQDWTKIEIGNCTCTKDSTGTYYLNALGQIVGRVDGNELEGGLANIAEGTWESSAMQAQPTGVVHKCTTLADIEGLIINKNGIPYVHGIPLAHHWTLQSIEVASTQKVHFGLPIFKDITGKRPSLPADEQVNPDKLVTLLNIKASINIPDESQQSLSEAYYNNKAVYEEGSTLINAGYYQSTVAITPDWNLQFLSSDFWKHGQAGIIDIADDIKPTYWYGQRHPFEFECIVTNDPATHKIFSNLELIANKAQPESFHYEIVGESYDFAKDKVNIYFRQEALKALWQHNGADLSYDRNFLKVQPKQQPRSADLIRNYYARQDRVNSVEDYYVGATTETKYDYRHLSGAEIVYYKNRNEYRIWQHAQAVDVNSLSQEDARSIIAGNCQYLEDRWKITINPILVCYKNEYNLRPSYVGGFAQITKDNTTWTTANKPKLPVFNSPIPSKVYDTIRKKNNEVDFPKVLVDLGYDSTDIDDSAWITDNSIYGTNFGNAQNRKEVDLKDRFIKIRIRYSGDELAVINYLNTLYRVSYV